MTTSTNQTSRATRLVQRRGGLLAIVTLSASSLLTTACESELPFSSVAPSVQYSASVSATGNPNVAQPGMGNSNALALLETFNAQVVGCHRDGQIEYVTGSHLALLTSVMRFTGTPQAKFDQLVRALILDVERGVARGTIAPACGTTLLATLAKLQSL